MDIGVFLAAIIPSALFLALILYYVVWGGGYAPKILKTKHLLKVVGISTKTSNDSFVEDDALLWEELKRLRNKNSMPKPENYILIKMMPKKDEDAWEYMIGTLVHDFDNVPAGLKTAEFKPQSYVMIRKSFKKSISWIESTIKIEKYLYGKWLPNSTYELNPDSPIKSIEYHNKKGTTDRTILFYVAVRDKKKS